MIRLAIMVGLVIGTLAGCAGQRLLPSPPEGIHVVAEVPGFQNIRVWGDRAPDDSGEQIRQIP